jgi:hypothetical protein
LAQLVNQTDPKLKDLQFDSHSLDFSLGYAAVLILLFLLHVRSLAHGHRASGGQVLLTHYMGFEDII